MATLFHTGFVELLARTNFAFLHGASHPKEIVDRAHELGQAAIGICDDASLAGMVRAHDAAKELSEGLANAPTAAASNVLAEAKALLPTTPSLKLLVGARFEAGKHDEQLWPGVALFARNKLGYSNLCRLITLAKRSAPKGEYLITLDDILARCDGLSAIVLPQLELARHLIAHTGGEFAHITHASSNHIAFRNLPSELHHAVDAIGTIRDAFGTHAHMAMSRHLDPNDALLLSAQAALAHIAGIPTIASNDPVYHIRERGPLHDVVTCIRHGTTLAKAGHTLSPNHERYLKSEAQMHGLFRGHHDAVARTLDVAASCDFSLSEIKYEYPDGICPPEQTPAQYLRACVEVGAARRYPDGTPPKVTKQVEYELAIIGDLTYEPYFLTIHEIVDFARARGVLCQGRGSAANSAVCFCLGITSVDPAHHDLLFERFISRERAEPPDIDIDFENVRREEVYEHIYSKYGRDRAALTGVVITYRRKSALREVGKVFGLSMDQVGALSRYVDNIHDPEVTDLRLKEAGLDPRDHTITMVLALARQLRGFPRHLSQHVGGFVMTRGRIDELVPVENAAMDGRTILQWDKDDLDSLGILKVDCLALGMLTAVQKSFALIEKHHGAKLDLARVLAIDAELVHEEIPEDVPNANAWARQQVYDMICAGDTVGVFQIESRAQMQMLPRLKPRDFYDLVIEVAIIRPGPIQGGMVHPYLRRRDGLEPVVYPHECTEQVLRKTLGVPLFQEQVMQLAMVAAGYTPGEADKLRKAMAAWKRNGALEKHREKLLQGMRTRGISDAFAENLYEQIKGFSSYGFPESHAASFALIVWVSCYLKRFYPAVFCAALANSQPMGFYSVASLVRDAREHGVTVLPPDVNASDFDCTLEGVSDGIPDANHRGTWGHGGPALRLGLSQIRGIKDDAATIIMSQRREGGRFRTIEDFARRTRIDAGQMAKLAEADAFASLTPSRREALWQVKAWQELPPLLAMLPAVDEPVRGLPVMGLSEDVVADYAAMGMSLRAHPIGLVRGVLAAQGVRTNASICEVPDGGSVDVCGIVLCRQRPGTSKGVVFMTIEDETGVANIVIWERVFEEHRTVGRLSRLVRVRGKVERDRTGKVINVICRSLADLRHSLEGDAVDAVRAGQQALRRHDNAPATMSESIAANTKSRDFH